MTFPKTREVPFERLLIEFDDRILQTIDEAIEYSNRQVRELLLSVYHSLFVEMNISIQCSTIDMECLDFNQFGADACKSVKAYGDTVVQMAIQLTYFKIHQKFALCIRLVLYFIHYLNFVYFIDLVQLTKRPARASSTTVVRRRFDLVQ